MTRKRGTSRRGARTPKAPKPSDAELETALGHSFENKTLLAEALTHSSTSRAGESYERLEFLGDRVLGLAVADMLIRRYPTADEGELAKRHTQMVRAASCASAARALSLADHLRLSRSETAGRAPVKAGILADAMEAVLGAVYLDAGFEAAKGVVDRLWPADMTEAMALTDPKSALQEWALARPAPIPCYQEVRRSGPDHDPVFVIRVEVEGVDPADAQGSSKREAEQRAARALLEREGVWLVQEPSSQDTAPSEEHRS